MDIYEFIEARVKDVEEVLRLNLEYDVWFTPFLQHAMSTLAFAKTFPILLDGGGPKLETVEDLLDPNMLVLRMSRNIDFVVHQEFIKRFGEEPPALPLLKALATSFSWHPDFQEEWRFDG